MGHLMFGIESFWTSLLDMRNYLHANKNVSHGYLNILWDKNLNVWTFHPEEVVSVESHCILIPLTNDKSVYLERLCNSYYSVVNPNFSKLNESFWLTNHTLDDLSHVEFYISLIVEEYNAKQKGECFVMHQQTLNKNVDDFDVVHSHRVRSMFEGVVVGWEKALADDCLLDSSAIDGEAPSKIIIDPKGDLADHIEDLEIFQVGAPAYILVNDEQAKNRLEKVIPIGSDVFLIDSEKETVQNHLAKKGIYSLLVEEGDLEFS